MLIDLEGQGGRGVKNLGFLDHDLNFAGGQVGVFVAFGAAGYFTDDLEDVLVT